MMDAPQTPREAGEAAFYECEGNTPSCLKAAFDAYEAAGEPVAISPLEWVDVTCARSDEDPTHEPTGDMEATTPFGAYYIDMGFGSDSYVWHASFDGRSIADKDDPDEAKAAAQADYDRRIRSALVPALSKAMEG